MLVEDDLIDKMTVQRALEELKVTNELVCVADGKEALDYLADKSNEQPCIILSDSNMPRMNGTEFLRIIKADDALKRIPVVVLTTSINQNDVVASFELGVAGYIVKRVDYNEFQQAIRTINSYWTLSKLPENE